MQLPWMSRDGRDACPLASALPSIAAGGAPMLRTFTKSLLCLTVTAWLSPHAAYAQRAPHVEGPHVDQAPVPHVEHAEHGEAAEHAKPGSVPRGPSLTVAQRIDANPQLVTRLTPLLPAGMTLDQAAAGFKNQGQ